jgi:hypothetical protein
MGEKKAPIKHFDYNIACGDGNLSLIGFVFAGLWNQRLTGANLWMKKKEGKS